MSDDASLAADWEADCLSRERRDYLLVLVVGAILYPLYLVWEVGLEPHLLPVTVPGRLLGTVAMLAAALTIRRTSSVRVARACFALAVVLASAVVAWTLPRVEHFAFYLLGYAAFLWACGVLSWPLRWTLALFGWLLAAAGAAIVADPHRVDVAQHLAVWFLLPTQAALTAVAVHARRAAHRAGFLAAHALAERNAELEVAMSRLSETQARLVAQEKLSALGRMLAGLSHEINNPINVIDNNLDPMREHVAAITAALALARTPGTTAAQLDQHCHEHELDWRIGDLQGALDDITAATAHVHQVHADLRTFIRGDAPDPVDADLADGLRATASLLTRRVPSGVDVRLAVPPLPHIRCRPGLLNQVWLNLLGNALDAVGPRGTIDVAAAARTGRIEVMVADSGPGIAPGFRERLFEPFATTKPPGQGTGLGLAISYQIIQGHGGRLYLDDRVAGGARFVVDLPLTPADDGAR